VKQKKRGKGDKEEEEKRTRGEIGWGGGGGEAGSEKNVGKRREMKKQGASFCDACGVVHVGRRAGSKRNSKSKKGKSIPAPRSVKNMPDWNFFQAISGLGLGRFHVHHLDSRLSSFFVDFHPLPQHHHDSDHRVI
jgi:hypothetical protein